jgi:haloacid dehalogenase-like hydrolase
MNDIEMIRWAGTGVAVANAEDEMKRQAAFIVPSNVHYGICTCIQNIVLPMLSNS